MRPTATVISVAIVGDFKPDNKAHIATNEALKHASAALGFEIQSRWIGTGELLEPARLKALAEFGGIWIAPASPYRSMDGALAAIRFGRENKIPTFGTCGGFQHIIIEFARNVLGLTDAQHEETSPGASRLFISRLARPLVGRQMTIALEPGSIVAVAYGQTQAREGYYCNFGV